MGRRLRGLLLLAVLLSSVVWLVISIHGLVHSATVYHVRVLDPVRLGTLRPSTQEATAMESTQNHWGESTMSAVAGVALSLVLLFVNTFLYDRRTSIRRTENR